MPRLTKNDQSVVEEFGFEFSAPPEPDHTRRSKHYDRWMAAKEMARKFPGQSLLVLSYDQPSQPYNIAKAINNGERREFKDDYSEYTAVAGKKDDGSYGLWLTYTGSTEGE